MATPPTRIGRYSPSTGNYSSTTTPKTTTETFTMQVGDRFWCQAQVENGASQSVVTPSVSAGAVTWTLQARVPDASNASQSALWGWTGICTTGASGVSVSLARPTTDATVWWGFSVTHVRGSDGIGAIWDAVYTTDNTAPSSAQTVQSDSLVIFNVNDWNARDGASRAYRMSATESNYFTDVNHHTVYGAYTLDSTAGTYTAGLTTPSTMRWGLIGVEFLGAAEEPVLDGRWQLEDGSGNWVLEDSSGYWVTEDFVGSGGTAASGTGSLTLSGTAGARGAAVATGSLTLSGTAAPSTQSAASATGALTLSGTATVSTQAATSAAGALTLSGTATARGVGVGTGSLTLSGTAGARGVAVGTGSLTLSGTAGARGVAGATGSLTLSGTAVAEGVTPGAAVGTGSLTLSGTAGGEARAAASGALLLSGTAGARAAVSGSGSLTLTGTASTSARVSPSGSLTLSGSGGARGAVVASGALTLSGIASLTGEFPASGSGSLTLTGSAGSAARSTASGSLSLTGTTAARATGSATGTLTLTGVAVSTAQAAAVGTLMLAGAASTTVQGTATGTLTLTGTAIAVPALPASAVGFIELSGFVSLVPAPDLFNPRGSIRVSRVRGTIRPNGSGSVRRDYARARIRT